MVHAVTARRINRRFIYSFPLFGITGRQLTRKPNILGLAVSNCLVQTDCDRAGGRCHGGRRPLPRTPVQVIEQWLRARGDRGTGARPGVRPADHVPEHGRFADTHARVGIMPGWGLGVLLPQAVGLRRAKQMSVTGNYIDTPASLPVGAFEPGGRPRGPAADLPADGRRHRQQRSRRGRPPVADLPGGRRADRSGCMGARGRGRPRLATGGAVDPAEVEAPTPRGNRGRVPPR